MKKQPLIIIAGPTAVGKTGLSVRLAEAIGGSIISADSMQVYRGMNIGTAKIRPEEMHGIPHYLIDCLNPNEAFHAAAFQEMAKDAVKEIAESGRVPILVGGTGFYIQALLYDVDFSEAPEDEAYRKELEEIFNTRGPEYLHKMLADVDPDAAEQIHQNNRKRMIRALEFHNKTGRPISSHNEIQRARSSPYAFLYYVLTRNRADLYDAINLRVDQMVSNGLIEEVRRLKAAGCRSDMVSMQGIGYKELIDCPDDPAALEEAVCRIKTDTRHFAKRQLTWFRREKSVTWLDRDRFHDSDEAILEKMIHDWKELQKTL